jgi:hypothetical protein
VVFRIAVTFRWRLEALRGIAEIVIESVSIENRLKFIRWWTASACDKPAGSRGRSLDAGLTGLSWQAETEIVRNRTSNSDGMSVRI